MINYAKKRQCIDDMRAVLKNPLKALRLLKAVRHNEQTPFEFVGYLQYYLRLNGKTIAPITRVCIHSSREARLSYVLAYIDECWRLGFVDDTQKMLLTLSAKVINKLISRYILIYLFL